MKLKGVTEITKERVIANKPSKEEKWNHIETTSRLKTARTIAFYLVDIYISIDCI